MKPKRNLKHGPSSRNLAWTCLVLLLQCSSLQQEVRAFSANPPPSDQNNGVQEKPSDITETDNPDLVSRRDVFDWPFLAVGSALVTGQLLSTAVGGLSLSRPAAHEQRVAETIKRALVEGSSPSSTVLRVLEVGIGSDCRLIRRGLYNPAIANLAKSTSVQNIEITGVDVQTPKATKVSDAQLLLDQVGQSTGVTAKLQVQGGSITSRLPFEDGSFDAVICCLTLCSVSNPQAAVKEMRRLVRPSGGTFGYVEHVAVNPEEPYRFLEWQQTTLDPLQQLVADNCHLHRYTQATIHEVFGQATTIQESRFLVDKMWPVTSQSCGVIQRNG